MRNRVVIVVLVVVFAGCMDSPVAPPGSRQPTAPFYSLSVLGVTDIGTLSGFATAAEDINELGQVAGRTSGLVSRAYLWQNGSIAVLEPILSSEASAINDHGAVAGTDQFNEEVAVVWQGATRIILVTLPATEVSHALGINNNNVVVGNVQPGIGSSEAFVWSAVTGMTRLFGPGGPSFSTATDISDQGAVVGAAGTNILDQRAFITRNGVTTFISLPGWTSSFATAVNEVGQVAGQGVRSSGEIRGFLWTPTVPNGMSGTVVELGTFGGLSSRATDVNDLGQVVGSSDVPDAGTRAFLWDSGPLADPNRLEDLGTLSPGSSNANAINNSGQVAGSSFAPDNLTHAVIWTVPILARIDIEPGDATNTVRLGGNGPLNVAILTSPFFNATAIDPASLTLGNEAGNDTPIALRRNLAVAASLKDVDRDGDLDLQAQFDRKQMTQNGDLPSVASTGLKLALLGAFRDGKRIRGRDVVNIVP